MERKLGDKLGPYELVATIGKGGMGEVWKGRDTRLHREVAIKFCAHQFSDRFLREARAIAALNHPNICTLHDIGPDYLVMEFIDGTPPRGPLAPAETVRLALGIAAALEAAHSKGITHRDLKPANILITQSGVKLLDFGLALVDERAGIGIADTATALTAPGAVMGTVAYMSPELALAQPVDARSDLWSLGVVLYEMATGTRPFEGTTHAAVFDAILNKAPTPVRRRNPKVPVEQEAIIARLLEKDLTRRYQSAGELHADLKRLASLPTKITSSRGTNQGDAPFVRHKQSADTAGNLPEYLCYISRDKIDQLLPDEGDEDPTSITGIQELQPLLVETISYGRPDLLQRERSLKREYVRRLQCFLRTHAQDIHPFHAESTPPALCWTRTEFRVEEIDQDALMASLVSTGATKLVLHCSLANFSNRCTDGKRFQPNSTNYGFFKQRLPTTFETVFYLTSRDSENAYGSPLFLKLALQSGINL